MSLPLNITAGDSISWSHLEYSYSAMEWVGYCVLFGAGNRYVLTATNTAMQHEFNLTSDDTSTWVAGRYDWSFYVVNRADANQRHTLATGKVIIKPDPNSVTDNRTHAERMVEIIEAVIEGKATKAQLDTLRARHNEREWESNPELLMKWRKLYQDEVTKQRNLEAIQAGGGINRTARILVRF